MDRRCWSNMHRFSQRRVAVWVKLASVVGNSKGAAGRAGGKLSDDPGKHRPKRETDARHLLAFSAFQSPNEPPLVYLYRGRKRKADARLGMPDLDNKND